MYSQNISGQKLSTYHPSAPAAEYSSCSPHMAAPHFPEAVKNTLKKTRQLYQRKSWGAAPGTAWAPWLSGSKAKREHLFVTWAQPAQYTKWGWGPARKWINGCKIKVLVTTSEARGDKIGLHLQLSSWHFPLCVFLTLHALFFFFVIYRVCDYPLLKG